MTKQEIKSISLVGIPSRTSNSYGRNLAYMRYRVLVEMPNCQMADIADLFSKEELKEIPYWSTRSESMSMTCWGTSQRFEAQISLGRWLGFNDKGDWSAFCRKCEQFIKVL